MGFIQTIINKHKEKVKLRNDMCDNLIMQIDTALQETTTLFSDFQSFVEPSKELEWRNSNASLIASVSMTNIQKLKKATRYKRLLEKQAELYRNANSLKQQISVHNDRVADAKIQNAYAVIGGC